MNKYAEFAEKVEIAHPPRFTFPGDELVSSDDYKLSMRQTYIPAFMQFEYALDTLGEDMPDGAAERAKRFMSSFKVFDNVLDLTDDPEVGALNDHQLNFIEEASSPAPIEQEGGALHRSADTLVSYAAFVGALLLVRRSMANEDAASICA